MRCFVAVELGDEARAAAMQAADDLRRRLRLVASWVRPDGLHLTLHFLGQVEPDLVPGLGEALVESMCWQPAFEVALGGAGAFPTTRHPRVLWFGVREGGEELAHVADRVGAVVRAHGVAIEDRPYRPHLTIARVRRPGGGRSLDEALAACPERVGPPWVVRNLTLFESILGRRGAVHVARVSVPLGHAR